MRLVQDDPQSPAHLIFVEHDPAVITKGRRAEESNILAPPQALEAAGYRTVALHHERNG